MYNLHSDSEVWSSRQLPEGLATYRSRGTGPIAYAYISQAGMVEAAGESLLFKGKDFKQTDVVAALQRGRG